MYAEGSPEVRTYTKNDGTAGISLTLRVFNIQLLGKSTGGDNSGGTQTESQPSSYQAAPSQNFVPSASDITEPVDDLPF